MKTRIFPVWRQLKIAVYPRFKMSKRNSEGWRHGSPKRRPRLPLRAMVRFDRVLIEGEFEGWDGETVFKQANGQVWQYATYTYHYAYQPKVTILKTQGTYKMKVDGVSSGIIVKRLK